MIVDRTLFITCCEAPRLLQPVDHPLHPFSGTVDGAVKGALLALVALPRDGDPDAVLPTIVPDFSAAVPLVAYHTPRTTLGPAAPRPLHSSLLHQVGKDRSLMPLPRRQDQRHELAMPFSPDVDFRAEAALTAPERFGVWVPCVCACGMLVRPDDGAIHVMDVPVELAGVVRLLLDGGKEACPEPRLPPAIKTAGNGAPRAIPLRQITPGGAGAEEPQDTVEDASVIGGWTACMRFLRRKQGL